ncbi:MAG: NAD-dependent epimerase/dehydratase family protein [Oceanipulchritudo sp.]
MAAGVYKRTGPVLLTGATGYIAGWVLRRLLEEGFTVHAAVRDPGNDEKCGPLEAMAKELPGTLRFFAADLLEEGSYAAAMAGCERVIHTASPFLMRFEDARRELVEPALEGTRNVLKEAMRTETVKRVVITSSCAAVYGDNADIREVPGKAFTEAEWNATSRLDHKPYSYSKTLAEKEAWKLAEGQDRWSLVALNPSLVLGPGIQPMTRSGSFELMRDLGNGTLSMGVPVYPFGAVDVREVAEAHLKASLDESVASGRYILSGHDTDLVELAGILRAEFGDRFALPRRVLPKWLVWLAGPFVDPSLTRAVISRNVGIRIAFDNRRSREILGIRYRPLKDSAVEMFRQMVSAGLVDPLH